ncbi:NADPH-dependent oxidoreductase [Miniphocaeibacter halophilus]|uniref:NADPH-dependent oxidoreductase n=1 Tax=Miniphocaeibacter halophilus TaxID=2931922 RepID=A0AC61MMW9_9FIRM|nr:NADPH-dependent oxidoreductase [Miniphocaeibacter halophilus]QQK06969.1 NADPH-dependent oxidoreductase [Miniphocaeibacter halophilus]
MNDTIKTQLNHRTIREFKEKEVPENLLEKFISVIQRTASSTGMQTSSVIRVTDNNIKKQIAEVCKQEYVGRAPELFIFIVDAYRNNRIAEDKTGSKFSASHDMDRFFQGWTDSCLAAQNLTNAVESEGLGGVFLGSVLNDTDKIIEILKLPELTFPVLGVAFGYPNQEPQLKPRMDMNLRVFENEYKKFDNYMEEIKDYDEEMQTYYDLREANRRVDSFSKQVIGKLENVLENRAKILNSAIRQGFDLKVEK